MDQINLGSTENHIGFQVHLTWRAIRKKLLSKVKKSDDRVSIGDYSIPILIGLNKGITPQELARALHLDASKVAMFLRGLEGNGIVARTPSQTDKRKVELSLTEKGEEFARYAMKASAEMESPVTSTVTEDELRELIRILTKIRNSF